MSFNFQIEMIIQDNRTIQNGIKKIKNEIESQLKLDTKIQDEKVQNLKKKYKNLLEKIQNNQKKLLELQTKNKQKYQKIEQKIEKMSGENMCEYFNIFISEKKSNKKLKKTMTSI
tara:strand:- start:158 stop:502 length:345 start_codon:yes stop_codon:yes gene_type:complete